MPWLIGLWRRPDFLRFWLSHSLSLLSLQFGRLALPLVAIVTLDASATQVGLLSGIGGVPWLVFGLFAGVGVDRMRRRPLIVVAHIGRAVLSGSVVIAAWLDALTIGQLYVVSFGAGMLGVCFQTAYHSYLPSLVAREELADGTSKLAVASGVVRTAGPGLAGAVVQWLTAPIGIGVGALSYLVAGVLVWGIRRTERPPVARGNGTVWAAFRDGLAFVWRQSLVRAFTVSDATFMFFFSLMQAVLLVFFTRNLNLSPSLIGFIFTAGSIGGLLGAIIARRTGERFGLGATILGGSMLRAVGLLLIPLAAFAGPLTLPALITSRLINALGWTLWQVHQETTQQLVTPDDLRGRVTGSSLFVVRSSEALGGFAAAAMAANVGVAVVILIGAFGALLSTLWLFVSPLLHSYRRSYI